MTLDSSLEIYGDVLFQNCSSEAGGAISIANSGIVVNGQT